MAAPKPGRMGRQEFLERSLNILSRQGESELRIERLVQALGVTKGSFYWHFQDRANFVQSLAEYWRDASTMIVVEGMAFAPTDATARLRTIMEVVYRKQLTKWDLAMRAWATHEPEVAKIVRQVDRARMRTVKGLMEELGFRDEELDMRTRLFVTYVSQERMIAIPLSRQKQLERIDRILEILTGK